MSSYIPWNDIRTILLGSYVIDPSLVAFPNEIFQNPEPPTMWVSVEATSNMLDPIELVGGVWQEEGTAYFNIMVPAGFGTDDARKLAKDISNLYRSLPPERPVIYRGGSIGNAVMADTEGMWWMITVSVDYIYDDMTTHT